MIPMSGLIRHAVADSLRLDTEGVSCRMAVGGRELTCRLGAQVLREECGCNDPQVWLAWAKANIKALNAAFEEKLSQPWGLPANGLLTIDANEWAMYRPYTVSPPDTSEP